MSSSRSWLLAVLALVLAACAGPPPKPRPTEIEMPSEEKHYIVSRPRGPARP